MQQHLPMTTAVSLIHNDYKYDNVVLDRNDITKIVGVLDWEMCTIGDSLTDLGTALAYWVDKNDPEEVQKNRWGPTTEEGSFTRAEIVRALRTKDAQRCFSRRLLSRLRAFQTSRNCSADLLPLSPGPDQRPPLRRHARNNPNAIARLPAHGPVWQHLKIICHPEPAIAGEGSAFCANTTHSNVIPNDPLRHAARFFRPFNLHRNAVNRFHRIPNFLKRQQSHARSNPRVY